MTPTPARLKLYLGSFAGVGKTFRMLQEAHDLRRRGVDVVAGFVETHGRAETAALAEGLEGVPRRCVEYRGVVLEEMDVDAILARRPRVALVDELAHTNVSTLNVQHLESLNRTVAETLGVTVRETVPDWVAARADPVVKVDVPAEELRQRLVDGKIYAADKVPCGRTRGCRRPAAPSPRRCPARAHPPLPHASHAQGLGAGPGPGSRRRPGRADRIVR